MKKYSITELTDCWLINGEIEIPKKEKPKKTKGGIYVRRTWFDDFVYDLFHFYS